MKEVTSITEARQQRLDDQICADYKKIAGDRILRDIPQIVLEARQMNRHDSYTVLATLERTIDTLQDYIRKCKQAAGPR